MDYVTRFLVPFFGGICIAFFILVATSPFTKVFAQGGLTGPFVPIEVERVKPSENMLNANVQMLYRAPTEGGAHVYANADINLTVDQATDQALKKIGDGNGAALKKSFTDDGLNTNSAGDGFEKDTFHDPAFDFIGKCTNTNNVSRYDCVKLTQAAVATNELIEFGGSICHPSGYNQIIIRYKWVDTQQLVNHNTWEPTDGSVICNGDTPSDPVPSPEDPNPSPEEMGQEFFSDSPPDIPEAPNPRSQGSPPPMMNPDFYTESDSQQFDMDLPSTPTMQSRADSMKLSYETSTSTTSTSSGLPSDMSFSAPPISSGSGSSTGGTIAGTEEGTGVDTCVANPNSLGCADSQGFLDSLSDLTFGAFDFSEPSTTLTSAEVSATGLAPVSIAGSGACPAPPTVSISSGIYTFENSYVCSGLSLLYPITILLFTVASAFLIAGAGRSS